MTDQPVRVMIHPFFFLAETWNGIDQHLLLFSRHLDRSRFALLLLIHESDGPQTPLLAERAGMKPISAPYPAHAGARTRMNALTHLLAENRVDLLHLHSPTVGGQAVPALAARMAGVKATLASYHQVQPRRLSAKSRTISWLTHSLLIDGAIAISQGVCDSLVDLTGLPRRRLRVILYGCDPPEPVGQPTALPPREPGEVRLGFFGRLSPEKGVSGLLRALALLAPRCPHARALIVGDGPMRSELESTASGLDLQRRVKFLGFRSDARQIMEKVDIVVHTPVIEGFGLVILEAMVAGRPVVINDAPGGMSAIVVDGETGLIVPSGVPAATADALARLIEDPAARNRLGANGRKRYEQHFSARRMTERIEAVYNGVLSGRRRTLPLPAAIR